MLVSQTQRARILGAAVRAIAKHGYDEMSVARITAGAGISRRTFYDLFTDREDCFLAVFEDTVSRARESMAAACVGERTWREQVRAGLLALLVLLDREPALRSLLVVDALKAGPRVQERRAELLGELSSLLHETGVNAKPSRELPALTGEGVVGAVLGVLHTRLMAKEPQSMVALLNSLMTLIVLPYLGPAAARRELSYPPSTVPGASNWRSLDDAAMSGLPMRITYRTLLVLAVIGEHPGASNRQIANRAEITDQGQISKLLGRLEGLGLVLNASGSQPNGEPNRWHLTELGQRLQQETRARPVTELQSNGVGRVQPAAEHQSDGVGRPQ